MTTDPETIGVYDAQSKDYAALTRKEANDPELVAFIARLPQKAHVLDLGCGPGHCAAAMISAGMVVDAVDASREMVKLAHKARVPARIARFSDIDENAVYDGIWASFSLLHAPRDEFPGLLNALYKATKPNGLLFLGMKLGEGESRDAIGRFYSYYSEEELRDYLTNAGFSGLQTSVGSGKGLAGDTSDFIKIACRKPTDA